MKTPWWFLHKTPLAIILLPVSLLYYLIGRIVFWIRGFGAYKSRRKIICIGNLFAGGVGKTPIVRTIATALGSPVVMRGYKKSAQTGHIGDEAQMLARAGLQVHTGNRRANIILLNKQITDKTPVVMDDGFQNPSIYKDVSILVFDEALGQGNGFLLPAGPMREPMSGARRADAIMVIKNARQKKNLKLPDNIPVFYVQNQTKSPYDENVKLYAFAGIGYPKKFFACLKNVVGSRAFPDHYQYTNEDIKKLRNAAEKRGAKLITTEKDWVRLPLGLRDDIKYANLTTIIDAEFFKWLGEKLK